MPALQRLGHEVVALPTVLLSHHPGLGPAAGLAVDPSVLTRMLADLDDDGCLAGVDALLTGYLPSPGHVRFAAEAVHRVRSRNPRVLIVCDPVLGDEAKGLYIEETAARALGSDLVGLVDMATPNAFELGFLSGREAGDVASAVLAARALPVARVLATSVPLAPGRLTNLLVTASQAWSCPVARRDVAPHGTGDLLAALYLGHGLNASAPEEALGRAVAGVDAVISASAAAPHLALVAALDACRDCPPFPVERMHV